MTTITDALPNAPVNQRPPPGRGPPWNQGGATEVALFGRYRATGDRRVRDEIVRRHDRVIEHAVRQFSRRGVDDQDLRQAARLAILRAADRFDPTLGVQFATFASRTIEGELKRYFRDQTWMVRPPRAAQDLYLATRRTEEALTHRLGRIPTVIDLADELGETVEHVLEAVAVGATYRVATIDQPSIRSDDAGAMNERALASAEAGFVHVDDELLVAGLLASLDERDRVVIQLWFYDGCKQAEIARRTGLSQSYLSRLIRRVLLHFREQLGDEVDLAAV